MKRPRYYWRSLRVFWLSVGYVAFGMALGWYCSREPFTALQYYQADQLDRWREADQQFATLFRTTQDQQKRLDACSNRGAFWWAQ